MNNSSCEFAKFKDGLQRHHLEQPLEDAIGTIFKPMTEGGGGRTTHRVPAVAGVRVLPAKKVNVKCQNGRILCVILSYAYFCSVFCPDLLRVSF